MYIKIFFYIEKLQTQIQEITNQLQMLHLKQIQVIQPGAFHRLNITCHHRYYT